MRKRILLMCAMALLGLAPLMAQDMTVTIADGATVNPNMPFVNSNAKGWSQSIYTASMINLPAGGQITAIAYECAQLPTTAWEQPQVTIYMANTSMTAAGSKTDWLQADTMTQVYSGTNAEATELGWHTITLTTPFEYTGGNLAIVVSKNGTAAVTALRYKVHNGDPAVTGSALHITATNTQPTGNGVQTKNLPNIKITLVPNAACMAVENLTASSSAAGLDLNWELNTLSTTPLNYEIEYGPHGFTRGEGMVVVTLDATPSYTITGLEPLSRQDVYVRAICGVGDTAPYVMISPSYCAPVTLPWTWDAPASDVTAYTSWNINNELPNCWEFPGLSTTAAGWPRIFAARDATFGLHLNVRNNAGNPAPGYIVLPEIDANLSQTAISLNASFGSTPFPTFQYGYMTNTADPSTFIALGDFVAGDNYKIIRESGINPPDNARLALRVAGANSAPLKISNIHIEELPTCQRPANLDTTRITTSSISLSWTGEFNTGESYLVYLTEFNQPDNVVTSAIVSTQEKTFPGLDPVHVYDAYVAKVCGMGNNSDTIKLGGITTYGTFQLTSNNNAWGTVSGVTTGPYNRPVKVYATPAPHYHFVKWVFDGGANEYTMNPMQQIYICRADNPMLQAIFAPDTFNVSVTSHNNERGTAAITTGATRMAYGSTLTVEATPASGYVFRGWNDGSTANPYTITVEREVNLVANFATNEEVLSKCSFDNSDWVTIVADNPDTIVPINTVIHYTVTLNDPEHYSLTGWRGLGSDPAPVEGPAGTWTVTHTATVSTVISPVISPNMYDLVLNVNAAGLTFGNITPEPGMHSYEFGSKVTIFAEPNQHCKFNGWSDNSTAARRDITIMGNQTLEANFSRDSFDVTANINVDAAGTVSATDGDGNVRSRYAYDEIVYLTAVKNTHYSFGRWTDGRNAITSPETHFRVYKNQSWTAVMGMEQFTISGNVMNGDGTVTPASVLADYNSQVVLTANDGEHYTFLRWDDGETDNPRTIVATATRTYRAEYSPREYAIATADDGHGTVSGAGNYSYGTTATLTATPGEGYHFDHWTNSADAVVLGGATINVAVEGDETYTAHFALIDYTVKITAQSRGELNTGNIFTTTAHIGDSWTVTATSIDPVRYVFKGWSDNASMDNPRTFTVVSSPIEAEAIFAEADEVSVSATASPAGSGSTAYSGTGSYTPGDLVTMTVTPAEGWKFKHWMPGTVNAQTYSFIIVSDTALTAVFEPETLYVSVSSNDAAMGGTAGSGEVEYDGSKTVTATAAAGYRLRGWTVNGVYSDGTSPYTINNIHENTTVVAEFEAQTYTVTLNGVNATFEGEGSYPYGSLVTIKATPDEHYDFMWWSDGILNAERTVMVTENIYLSATVMQHGYTVTPVSDDVTMGTVSAPVTKSYGESVTVTAEPYEHYDFLYWEDGTHSEATYSFAVTRDTILHAFFAPKHYRVTLTQPAATYGSIELTDGDTVGGCVNGTVLTYTANENNGMNFMRWIVNGAVRTGNPLTIVVHGNTTIEAEYEQALYRATIATNNSTMGTAVGTGNYYWGETVNPVAVVNDTNAYRFVSWSDGETALSHTPVTVNGDVNLTAVFGDRDRLMVAVLSNNDSWGSAVASATSVLMNTDVDIAATAATDYHFVEWSDGDTNSSRTITVTDNVVLTAIFARNQVRLAYGDAENGTVSGADTGMYDLGSKVTFYAEADENYHFAGWQDDNTDNPRTVVLSADNTFTPSFAKDRYTVTTVMANGTVTAGGTYDYGTVLALTATADENYLFDGWMRNGMPYDGTENINITVTENVTFEALTAKSQRSFSVAVAEAGTGYVDGTAAGSYDFDAAISVTAMPALNYHFVCWNNDMEMTNPHIDTTLANGDVSLTAYFAIDTYNVSVATTAGGNVDSSINGSYNYGDVVMFVATPDEGYVFANWDGDINMTVNPMAEGVRGNISHVAYFTLAQHTLTVSSNNAVMGTAAIDDPQPTYLHGATATVRATSNDNNLYRFVSWSDGDTAAVREVTVVADIELMAIFSEVEKLTVVALSNNNQWGSVTASESSVAYGSTVTLTATENEHYHLMRWNDLDDTMHVRTITVVKDTVVTAIFIVDNQTLTLDVEGNGTVNGAGEYAYGSQAMFYATAGEHSHFVRWSDDVTDNPRTVVMDGDKSFTAIFGIDSVVVLASAVNGTVNAERSVVLYGDSVTLTATGNEHYHLMRWSDMNDTMHVRTIIADKDSSVTAIFVLDNQTLTLDVEGNGTVNGAGEYAYGSQAMFYATAGEHSHFVRWSDSVTDNPRTVVMDGDKNFTAIFGTDSVVVLASAVNGTVNAERTVVLYGDSVTLTAAGNEHYSHFQGWSRNGVAYDGDETISFVAAEDASFVASFAIDTVTLAAEANNRQWGYVTGSAAGEYAYGTEVTLVAVSLENSHFEGWFNEADSNMTDTLGTADTLSLQLVEDRSVVAVFARDTYIIDVTSSDTTMGTVTGGGVYNYHDLVVVEAQANEGYLFMGWSDSVAETSRYFYVESDTSVTALFDHERHTVSVIINDTTMGTVLGAGVYNWGDTAYLTAVPNNNFTFMGFNSTMNGDPTLSIVVTEDVVVTATFDHKPVRLYTEAENGRVEAIISGIAADTDRQPIMARYSDDVTLTAIADEHYSFVEWQSYYLVYDTVYDTITVIDSIWIVSTYFNDDGEEITVYDTLSHTEAVQIVNTTRIADTVMTENPYQFNITCDRVMVAVFEPRLYTVNISGMHGVYSGDGIYRYGDTVTISCEPDVNYRFIGWSGVSMYDVLVNENPCTFVVERDMNIIGYCEAVNFHLVVEASPAEGGVVSGTGYYEFASNVVITATPHDGYRFISWSDGDTNAIRTITVTSDTTFTAIFRNLGIEQTDMSDVNIYATGDAVVVDGANGMTVRLFDALGRVVATAEAHGDSLRIPVKTTGVYLVQVGNAPARRVMLMR